MLSTKHSTGMVRVQSRYKTTLHATYVPTPTPTRHDTHLQPHTHTCMHVRTHMQAHTHAWHILQPHICTHTHAHTNAHKCTHTCKQRTHATVTATPTHSHTHTPTPTYTHAPTHPHAHTHTRTHTHMHTYTHIHILEQVFRLCRSQTQEKPVVVEDYTIRLPTRSQKPSVALEHATSRALEASSSANAGPLSS